MWDTCISVNLGSPYAGNQMPPIFSAQLGRSQAAMLETCKRLLFDWLSLIGLAALVLVAKLHMHTGCSGPAHSRLRFHPRTTPGQASWEREIFRIRRAKPGKALCRGWAWPEPSPTKTNHADLTSAGLDGLDAGN